MIIIQASKDLVKNQEHIFLDRVELNLRHIVLKTINNYKFLSGNKLL